MHKDQGDYVGPPTLEARQVLGQERHLQNSKPLFPRPAHPLYPGSGVPIQVQSSTVDDHLITSFMISE